MTWLTMIASVIAVIGLAILLESFYGWEMDWLAGLGGIGLFILAVILFLGTFFASLSHVSDLESIQYNQERVEIHKERLDRLRSTLEGFEYPENALLNHDSPVASIVDQISETEKQIAESKEAVAENKRDIRERKRWMFSFVTTWYDES